MFLLFDWCFYDYMHLLIMISRHTYRWGAVEIKLSFFPKMTM